jgi:hypothetical protein
VRMIGEPCWQRHVELVQLNETHPPQRHAFVSLRSELSEELGGLLGQPQTRVHGLASESERGESRRATLCPPPHGTHVSSSSRA